MDASHISSVAPVEVAAALQAVQISLTTLFGIVAGVVFACVYCIMYNKETRDSAIALSVATLARVTLQNPKLLDFLDTIRRWFSNNQAPVVFAASLLHNDKVMHIPFVLDGKNYELLVPYDRREARNGGATFSVDAEGNKTDLHHHPGIPFTVTREQLQCANIVRSNDDEM